MRPHPKVVARRNRLGQLGRAAAVGGIGAVWGLGLARLLAEGGLWKPFYAVPLVVAATAITCAGLALVMWRVSSSLSSSAPVREGWASFLPLTLSLPYVLGAVPGPLAGGVLLLGGAAIAVLIAWRDQPGWMLPVLLGLVTLCLYLRTLLPSIGEADTLEFQVVAANLGVAHPTGYPLYILLAKLFTLLPLKNVAWRVNLASAVFAAGAVVALYGMVRWVTEPRQASASREKPALPESEGRELASGSPCDRTHELLSLLAAVLFAFSATFWSQALVAEVYTLHNLLMAVILGLLLRQLEPSQGRAVRWRIIFLLLGLSLTNHLTTVLLLPAVALTVLIALARGGGRWKAQDGLGAAGLFLLGLSVYLFVLLRWPALNEGRWMGLGQFLRYVTGGQFHGALHLDGWQDPARWRILGRLLYQPFRWPGIALSAVGVTHLAIRRRWALAVTGVTFLAFSAYGLLYYVADIAVFLLPAHLILAVWVGVGMVALTRLLLARIPLAPSPSRAILVALFALVPLSGVWMNLPVVDRSQDWGAYDWGQYALDQPLETGGAILADIKKFAPLYYLQQVEGVRPDLDVVLLGSEELYQEELRRRLGEGQTVYLARYLPHLEGLYLRSVGPLAEVRSSPLRAVSSQAIARLGERVELLDADVAQDPLGRALRHVMLHWRAERPVQDDLVVRLRLVDTDGQVRWKGEGRRPVNGLYPTNAWPVGVSIFDYHPVPVEPWLPPGTYSLQVGLLYPFGDEGLTSGTGSDPWVSLGAVEVRPPSEPEPLHDGRPVSMGSEIWLTGIGVPEEGTAGGPLTVDLAWRGVVENEQLEFSWDDGRGRGAGHPDAGHPDAESTFSLPAGMVRSRHTITAPGEIGVHTLHVGLVAEDARCRWLAPPERSCGLAQVRILAGQDGLANFGDRVLLVEAEVGRHKVSPGELIPVALRWRGLRRMEVNYTVFVHLMGPDGRLHGQADSWPVQGTHPTSQWRSGQGVSDPYKVQLAPDAPPGKYRVVVGLYELETMERLRVLDETRKPVADSLVVGVFDVPE